MNLAARLQRSPATLKAIRYTDYSTSGGITSWKVGLTYVPVSDVRLRFTRSRDIRAPNLSELFNQGSQGHASINDPATGQFILVKSFSAGNPFLDPELADTTTVGIVYEPSWFPGLTASVDAYDIEIEGAIAGLGAQQIVNDCFNGAADLCQFVTRHPDGTLNAVFNVPYNLQSLKTSGVDVEIGYRSDLSHFLGEGVGGSLALRAIGTYVDKLQRQAPGAAPVELAGDVGTMNGGTPHWKWLGQGTYSNGPVDVTVQVRYTGSGNFDNRAPAGSLNIEEIESQTVVNLMASYAFEDRKGTPEIYLSISNLFNQDPPINPWNFSTPFATNVELYDIVGRMFRVGFRLTY